LGLQNVVTLYTTVSMTDPVALIRMPDPQVAPGYRQSLTVGSHFAADDLGDGIVAVAPSEGAGMTAEHFQLHKICDAQSDLADPLTWTVLRTYPPRPTVDDAVAFRDRMIALGDDVRTKRPGLEGDMVAFKLAAMGAAQTGEVSELLEGNLGPLFVSSVPMAPCGR
jgi:hypothetical protein